MELDKIELVLEKYFQGITTIAEEKELQNYFSSKDVAPHLEQYQPLFGYFNLAKKEEFKPEIRKHSSTRNVVAWISIAASIVVLFGIGMVAFNNLNQEKPHQDLGTYDDPEVAFRETQKALALLSTHVNVGIGSIQYIEQYEATRDKIFITD